MQDDPEPIKLSGYGIAGNAHAMDAAMKLPRGTLHGSILSCWDKLGIAFQQSSTPEIGKTKKNHVCLVTPAREGVG